MLNFVLCDDNKNILDKLAIMLESILINNDYDGQIVYKCHDANSLLDYVKNNSVDVLLLDINLNSNISGIALADEIRKTNKRVYIIFTTGHLEYALLAYKVKTFDYLPKPITIDRLSQTISRLFADSQTNPDKFIRVGNSKILLKGNDVNYIMKNNMKIIYCTNNQKFETYSSFSRIMPSLPENFIRCHKSYIVNINNIKNIDSTKNQIIFNEDILCSIGPKFKKNFMEVFNDYANYTDDNKYFITTK